MCREWSGRKKHEWTEFPTESVWTKICVHWSSRYIYILYLYIHLYFKIISCACLKQSYIIYIYREILNTCHLRVTDKCQDVKCQGAREEGLWHLFHFKLQIQTKQTSVEMSSDTVQRVWLSMARELRMPSFQFKRIVSLSLADEFAKDILSDLSHSNPSSMAEIKTISSSSLGQGFSPSTRILIPNIIPAMQMKYPATFHHASLPALKEFERMLDPRKIVTMKSASHFRVPFVADFSWCNLFRRDKCAIYDMIYSTLVTPKRLHQLKSAIKSCGAMLRIHGFSGSHQQTLRQLLSIREHVVYSIAHHKFPDNEQVQVSAPSVGSTANYWRIWAPTSRSLLLSA